MKFFKSYGSKERLFEMMKNVAKPSLNENGFDYHAVEMDHLGQQDLDADQAEHPENHNQTVTPPADQQAPVKESVNYNQFSDQELDQLYTKMFGKQAYHMSREGYIHALSGNGENPNNFVHDKAIHLNQTPFSNGN